MPGVAETSLPIAAALAVSLVAGLVYITLISRRRPGGLTLLDVLFVVALMSLTSGTAIPAFYAVSARLKSNVLQENLRVIRAQIDRYRIEHFDKPPLLYQGEFPQLEYPTNAQGEPGIAGRAHPYGPYLPNGLPVNPITGSNVVSPTSEYPPQEASEKGGWLYHQETGQIAPDLEDYLDL